MIILLKNNRYIKELADDVNVAIPVNSGKFIAKKRGEITMNKTAIAMSPQISTDR